MYLLLCAQFHEAFCAYGKEAGLRRLGAQMSCAETRKEKAGCTCCCVRNLMRDFAYIGRGLKAGSANIMRRNKEREGRIYLLLGAQGCIAISGHGHLARGTVMDLLVKLSLPAGTCSGPGEATACTDAGC